MKNEESDGSEFSISVTPWTTQDNRKQDNNCLQHLNKKGF